MTEVISSGIQGAIGGLIAFAAYWVIVKITRYAQRRRRR